MMAPHAPRLAATTILVAVICGSLALTVSAWAAGPVFESPTDGARVRGLVTLRAEKSHLDGNSSGYLALRIAREGANLDKAPFTVALVSPFEYSWDTQETYLNEKDSWDPLNGSRLYGDGRYVITAVAFDSGGRPVGEAASITVTVANRIEQPGLDANGRIRLRAGGREGEEIRYRAEGSLLAELDPDEVAKLTDPTPPPRVELRMGATWRNTTRKAMGPAHTADGRRWHAQLDEGVTGVAPDGRALSLDWRNLSYGVRDEHIESGFCEFLGMTYQELYDEWRDGGGMALTGYDATILTDLPGALPGLASGGGAAGGAVGGGMMGGAGRGGGGMTGPGGGAGGGAGRGAAGGMGPAGPAGGGGAPGGAPGMAAGGGGWADNSGGGLRADLLLPLNLAGLGKRYRSVVRENNAIDKMYRDDPRWPLAELWTPLPGRPVKVGDSWSGGMTIMPFFDQEFHLYVPGGGAATGPAHMTPLYNRYYVGRDAESMNEGYGPGYATPIHVLDGFEVYKGYECARIVSRFRNYSNTDDWTREHKTGWWLSDLNPRMFGNGQMGAGNADTIPMVRTDLTRVTYFAYRSGQIVGIEDHYQHKLWLDREAFKGLASNRQPTRERQQFTDIATLASTLGLPAPATAGATPAAAGQGGAPGGMMGGPAGGAGGGMMGGPGGGGMMGGGMMGGGAAGAGGGMPGATAGGGMMGGGMGGGGAAATNRNGWAIGDQWTLFGAPQGGGGAAAGAGGGMMGGGAGGGMPGMGGGMPGMGGGAGRGAGGPGGGGMMPGGPGGGGGMMGGAPGGGMPGMMGGGAGGAAGGGADDAMANAWAHVVIKIMQQNEGHSAPGIEYAALPPTGASATVAPVSGGAASTVRRYVVVEDTGTFYLAGSALARGKRGIELSISAEQLIGLGFTPAPDLKF